MTSMAKNVDEFEIEAQTGWAQFSSPVEIMHMTSKARTLPSSHGSSGSMHSSESSLEAPPEEQDDTTTVGKIAWTQTKTLLVVTTFLLLFGCGILGGLMATGGLSRNNDAAVSTNNGNATTNGGSGADVVIEVFDEPTVAPVEFDNDNDAQPTDKPTSAPTVAPTNKNEWVTIPAPADPLTLADGSYDYRANSEFLVGAYYYPWHKNDFHNNGGYLRKFVVPRQYPSLGEYDDSDPAVIKEHMKMFRRANIGLLVTSWWGPNRLEDTTTKDVVMEHEDVGNLKVALFYETTNRLKNGLEDIANSKTDIEYMCDHYFDHPNYYKVDGRPVLFIYLARTLENKGAFEEVLLTMRSEAAKRGHNIFLVGDYVFGSSPRTTVEDPYIPFWYFDAVTNYDVYGSSGRPQGHAGHTAVSLYYDKQAEWKEETAKENCRFIPAVSPGYNDRGVRLESDHPALSRRLTKDSEEGSLFHYQLKHAKKLADLSMDKLIMVNSFNEWHEDTQIEPVKIGDSAVWPPLMTQDLEYVGYGNLYLDILGASTRSNEGQGIFDYLYEY